MSRYAIVHLRHGDVEAVFFSPDMETAVAQGLSYAIRSGFFGPLDDEFMGTIERELRYDRVLAAEAPREDRLVIRRVFEIGVPV